MVRGAGRERRFENVLESDPSLFRAVTDSPGWAPGPLVPCLALEPLHCLFTSLLTPAPAPKGCCPPLPSPPPALGPRGGTSCRTSVQSGGTASLSPVHPWLEAHGKGTGEDLAATVRGPSRGASKSSRCPVAGFGQGAEQRLLLQEAAALHLKAQPESDTSWVSSPTHLTRPSGQCSSCAAVHGSPGHGSPPSLLLVDGIRCTRLWIIS